MIEFETHLRAQLHQAAATQTTPPGFRADIEKRARRQGPRTAVLRAAAVVAVAVAVVGGSIALSGGDGTKVASGPPSPTTPGWHPVPGFDLGGRSQGLTLAMGEQVLVWGGHGDGRDSEALHDGAVYDPRAGTWRQVSPAPLDGRGDAIGAWTGDEAIVVTGDRDDGAQAAAYDPERDTWRELPAPPLANAANAVSRALWTGDELVVTGSSEQEEGRVTYQTAIYEPGADRWRKGASETGLPAFGDAVWTGQEVVVVGELEGAGGAGVDVTAVRAYDPAADRWRELDWGLDESRERPVVAWTGDRLFVGGGYTIDGAHAEARLLDVDTGEWEAVPDAPVPFGGNYRYGEVWTGKEVITLYGQAPGSTEDDPEYRVLAFDPDARTWATGPSIPDRAFDFEGSWAWTGTEIAVLGGGDIRHSDQGGLDGATYVPVGG